MPRIATKYFGVIEYREDEIIRFPSGLPAFERELEFLAIERPANAPLVFLQSARTPGLCFLALPIEGIDRDYRLAIIQEDLRALGLPEDRQPRLGLEIRCLAIVAVTDSSSITANLLAPIVINPWNGRGLQAVRPDSVYSHRHPVVEGICS
jgi:flagellar assembly factor FliW